MAKPKRPAASGAGSETTQARTPDCHGVDPADEVQLGGYSALTASAVRHADDFRQLHLFTAIGDRLENASDALKHASLILHEHMLKDVIDG